MNFPNSYDDLTTLGGDLADQKTLILKQGCDSVQTTLYFESVAEVSDNIYARLGEEIILIVSTSSVDNSASVLRSQLGTQPAAHTAGDAAFVVLVADYLNVLRDAALATQKYQGLVGPEAARPANPTRSEAYIAVDKKKVYVCLEDGVWSYLGGVKSHAETLSLDTTSDDHPQYFTDDRLAAWHDALAGAHVTDRDNHDHSHGSGIGRVPAATSGTLPEASDGKIRLTTDTGELVIGNAALWVAVTGAPSGAIVAFMEADLVQHGGACPPGWQRYTDLDGRFPLGAPAGVTSPMNQGGSLTHSHTYSSVPEHTHDVPSAEAESDIDGSHTHEFAFSTLASGTGMASTGGANSNGDKSTSVGGSHSHSATFPSVTTGDAVATEGAQSAASASTSTEDSVPPYQEVVFCQKL